MGQLILMMSSVSGASDWLIWNAFFSNMFTATAAVLFLFTLRVLANSIETGTRLAAAPDTSEPESSSTSEDDVSEVESESEENEDHEGTGGGLNQSLANLVGNPGSFLAVGIIALAYFGLLELIFGILLWDDFAAGNLWRVVFGQVAVLGGAVGLLLAARLIVIWSSNHSILAGDWARDEEESRGLWAERVLNQPKLGLDISIVLLLIAGASFFLIDVWSDRNLSASDFWATLLEDSFYGLAGLGTLLMLRAILPLLSGGMNDLGNKAQQASIGPALSDPGRLLRMFTYVLAYVGLAWVAISQISIRNWADGWETWYVFLLTLLISSLPLGIYLGFQALYAELVDHGVSAGDD